MARSVTFNIATKVALTKVSVRESRMVKNRKLLKLQ